MIKPTLRGVKAAFSRHVLEDYHSQGKVTLDREKLRALWKQLLDQLFAEGKITEKQRKSWKCPLPTFC